ncbi:(2Fe-2S)-binding protein [Aquamicrobium defluvii]|uniref:2Fe-2S iron-sulfur cluster protein n=1 Tax=Aquamicrobium defluvii TaxID=69279 RepID=A0A011U879_9HYPH|nr:(2Fe-2S)-binding protein [Aquamicrobium defluvii]EXL02306.1 NAD(FAD)-dependent dehydrogenase [Aquamicrobium defluvii]EZQ13020.1 NAD(FAD)-dependent dehydrogenase [Halopseudomonas bauzanensis]TDR32634.1 2Fe-2S iron-sulfur cluster protein [Aquamicrobium defluvii]
MYSPRFHSISENDRQKLTLLVDGVSVEAREGDTLLTALMRHDGWVRTHEFDAGSRAGFCAMGACQDCWVTLADGQRLRACTTPVRSGMAIVRKPAINV